MSARTCTLLGGIRVERGVRGDWLALSALHYRSHHAGAVTDIFRMTYGEAMTVRPQEPRPDILVGVIVYSRSPLSLAARDRATGGRYRTGGLGRVAFAGLINRELRIISRVVLTPNWRGLGLGSRLVAETLPQVGVPYVETLAAMGEMHPLFVRAGMAAYPQPPSAEGERLRAALEAAGLARADRRSAARLEESLRALDPLRRRLAEREIVRWARSYLGAKNHRTNRPDRRRMLDLVARHLDSAPVYYLWRNENLCPSSRPCRAANGKESS
jgi:GNAT superfamily N-acetyltransferase